jgi:hypothetical protein
VGEEYQNKFPGLGMDWINLVPDRNGGGALVDAVMNFQDT